MKFHKFDSKVRSAREAAALFEQDTTKLGEYHSHLTRILQELPQPTQRFVGAGWYHDPRSHDCPHDAWLMGTVLNVDARGDRRRDIRITLLGAYHDRQIELLYTGVTEMRVSLAPAKGRPIEWVCDEFDVTGDSLVIHEILWDTGEIWMITASCVDFDIKQVEG